ncbi:hypothetical protein PDE_06690 [Penicillium oxalicum 114-2]|uniref:Uncharacterized protein n=1 Tax=Penicillium oxalicum (strain 114-2 / CGMCC 5302) TaxID=933388 RepID=S8AZ66_PENO1|nr:hypothetical protein PDE_06690 [Penicillium oxalicum 114-2]
MGALKHWSMIDHLFSRWVPGTARPQVHTGRLSFFGESRMGYNGFEGAQASLSGESALLLQQPGKSGERREKTPRQEGKTASTDKVKLTGERREGEKCVCGFEKDPKLASQQPAQHGKEKEDTLGIAHQNQQQRGPDSTER